MEQGPNDPEWNWFEAHCGPSARYREFPAGLLFYHGYRRGLPALDNLRALWVTQDPLEARDYAQVDPAATVTGILRLRLGVDLTLRQTNTSAARFLGSLDPQRSWPERHSRYARSLHAWGRRNYLAGIVEEHGSVVLFLAADYLEVLGNCFPGDRASHKI